MSKLNPPTAQQPRYKARALNSQTSAQLNIIYTALATKFCGFSRCNISR